MYDGFIFLAPRRKNAGVHGVWGRWAPFTTWDTGIKWTILNAVNSSMTEYSHRSLYGLLWCLWIFWSFLLLTIQRAKHTAHRFPFLHLVYQLLQHREYPPHKPLCFGTRSSSHCSWLGTNISAGIVFSPSEWMEPRGESLSSENKGHWF